MGVVAGRVLAGVAGAALSAGGSGVVGVGVVGVVGLVRAGMVSPASGAALLAEQPEAGGAVFGVSRLELKYAGDAGEAEGAPSLREVLYDEVELAQSGGVFDAPGADGAVRRLRVFELVSGMTSGITPAGLDALLAQLERSVRSRGLAGAIVRPDPSHIARVDGRWVDRRLISKRLRLEIALPEPEVEVAEPAAPVVDEGSGEAAAAPAAEAGPPLPPLEPREEDGPGFEVTGVRLGYVREHPQHPPISELEDTVVMLTLTPEGYIAARAYAPVEAVRVSEIGSEGAVVLHASAIASVAEALVRELGEAGLIGVYTEPSRRAIERDPTGFRDLRDGQTGVLPIDIYTSIVTRVGSSATGDRIGLDERIDNRKHRRIRERSPLVPYRPVQVEETGGPADAGEAVDAGVPVELPEDRAGPERPERLLDALRSEVSGERRVAEDRAEDAARAESERRDLLREDVLNDYARRLSRHPGRRVDVAIAPGLESFEAEVQYIVREDKPWSIFTQLSNTGAESTGEFRQRIGFVHNQLTGADDILAVDYTTSEYSGAHALIASYERPLLGSTRAKWRVSGGWNEFTAADVGSANEQFEGQSWFWNAELSYTALQRDELFVDVFAGMRYQWIQVTNFALGGASVGEEAIFLPRVGARAERAGEWSNLFAQASLEWTENHVTNAQPAGLQDLGRLNPVGEWMVFNFDMNASVYLEPLLFGRDWYDPSTPKTSTLAHELVFRFSGQYAFNDRLIPNAEGVIGGLFTVRGYPESRAAGDTVFNGSLEYRFHLPRALAIDAEPPTVFGRPFRVAPQQVYGSPDWDLILKAFVDFGRSYISQPLAFEQGESLLSTGVGIEVQLLRNMSFRADWGIVLDELSGLGDDPVRVGDSRVHLLFTLVY